MAGWSGQERYVMVKKIVKRTKPKETAAVTPKPKRVVKPKAAPADPYLLTASKVVDEEADAEYWEVEGKGAGYYLGFDDRNLKHFVYDPNGETGWEVLSGWSGFMNQRTLLRNLGRYLLAVTPLPDFKVQPHPKPEYGDPNTFKAFRKVALADAPYHPSFPIIRPDLADILPKSETYFRWDPKEKRVTALVTKDADGVHIAWTNCKGCSGQMTTCRCPNGMTPPRSIEWCCERAADGWSDERRSTPSRVPTTAVGPGRLPSSRVTPSRAKVAPVPTPAASKPAERPTDATVAALDAGTLDLGALSEKAAAQAAADTKSVRRVIKKKRKATK